MKEKKALKSRPEAPKNEEKALLEVIS